MLITAVIAKNMLKYTMKKRKPAKFQKDPAKDARRDVNTCFANGNSRLKGM